MADSGTLMSISDPVHLVLIRSEPTGESHIVSSHYFEWRPVLAAPFNKCSMSVELTGIGKRRLQRGAALYLHLLVLILPTNE